MGHSFDFCRPTEGLPFIGFKEQEGAEYKELDGCSWFTSRGAIDCEAIGLNVALAMYFPDSQSVCEPYAGIIYHPVVQVGVNLSAERKVQGLLFTTQFLSVKLEDQLFEPLGGVNLDYAACTDADARNRFDELAQRIARAVIDGRADEETTYQLGLIKAFARSIQVNSP